jgi:hypothetical protein
METADVIAGAAAGPAPTPARIALQPHPLLPWLMLPEGVPSQVLMEARPVAVPNTRAWFRGMVSQRGNVLPVFDIGQWAGLEQLDPSQARIVAVGIDAHACALVCHGLPTLVTVHGATPCSDDWGLLAPYLGDMHTSAAGAAYHFDLMRWLADAAQRVTTLHTAASTH